MGSSKSCELLFIIDNLGSGGAQIQILNLASKLADKSYSITVHIYASNDQANGKMNLVESIQLIYNSKSLASNWRNSKYQKDIKSTVI